MSAFLMNERSLSELAFNLFDKGKRHEKLAAYIESRNITCPEDLYKDLTWQNMKSLTARYGEKYKKSDIPEYHFNNNTLTIPQLVKKIGCWQYQSCEDESVEKGRLYKALTEFKQDCAMKYLYDSEEYNEATWG